MKAMIFAAGLGTRLKPITTNMPKAMLKICGKPLLYYVLKNLQNIGYTDFVINVHHFPEQIINYLQNCNLNLNYKISNESLLLRETGGGLYFAKPYLINSPYFLVHNVDILSNLNIDILTKKYCKTALATLVVSNRKTSRYLLFNDQMRLVGWTNIETKQVRSPFKDINPAKCKMLAFAGIHLVSNRIFNVFDNMNLPPKFSIIDFYINICHKEEIYGYIPPNFKMVDVGKLESISLAEDFIINNLNSI